MTGDTLLAFVGVALVVIVTPGPDTALTIRNTLLGGRAAGGFTALGVAGGQLTWALAASAGVVAILLASEPVFHAVRLAGAAYLIGLGVHSLRSAWRARGGVVTLGAGRHTPLGAAAALRQGYVSNLGNPKMAVFFASVLPQFAPHGEGMMSTLALLGVLFASLTLAWLAVYAAAIAAVGGRLGASHGRRALEAAAGAVMIALGVRVALSRA